jgi:hypothetical protein
MKFRYCSQFPCWIRRGASSESLRPFTEKCPCIDSGNTSDNSFYCICPWFPYRPKIGILNDIWYIIQCIQFISASFSWWNDLNLYPYLPKLMLNLSPIFASLLRIPFEKYKLCNSKYSTEASVPVSCAVLSMFWSLHNEAILRAQLLSDAQLQALRKYGQIPAKRHSDSNS